MKNLMFILIATILVGCSARKVQNHKEKIAVKQEVTEQVKTDSRQEIEKEEIKVSDTDELEIAPVSNEKPLIVIDNTGNKTTVYNGKISRKKAQVKHELKEHSKTEVVRIENRQSNTQFKKKTKSKAVERKPSYMWLWWLLLLIPIVYGVYRIRSRAS